MLTAPYPSGISPEAAPPDPPPLPSSHKSPHPIKQTIITTANNFFIIFLLKTLINNHEPHEPSPQLTINN
jgi:hypothetical protein